MVDLAEPSYDVFVSYKTRRHLDEASWIAEQLSGRGFHVWFDRKILDEKKAPGKWWSKDELIEILAAAVRDARCSVIFEAQLEAVMLPPYSTAEEALANKSVMLTDTGGLIAWNWQKLEIDASIRGIAVHAREVWIWDRTRQGSAGVDIVQWPYANQNDLLGIINEALVEVFGIKPGPRAQ